MRLLLSCVLALGLLSAGNAQITVKSLVNEMVDLTGLSKEPKPYYKTAQASSYDRKSTTPGNEDWFANGDAGQYIRVEEHDGRKEYVMADLTGPGAVVRIWSANPFGVLRFYFDGEATPRLVQPTGALVKGEVKPFGAPFGYLASSGCNLYFPFPYSKSLKITVDDSEKDGAAHMYYHVGYRTYEPSAKVTTFTMDQIDSKQLSHVGTLLVHPEKRPMPSGAKTKADVYTIKPGEDFQVELANGRSGAIYEFTTNVHMPRISANADWTDPKQPQNVLRQTILQIYFDGNRSVQAPIGDFYGSVPGIVPLSQFPFTVTADGTMTCRFVMPFQKSATAVLTNYNQFPIEVSLRAVVAPYKWDDRSYYFKTQWTGEEELDTRPMRDMEMLRAIGSGCWLGSNLSVSNPVPAWWGEGDEKVTVDEESFPSTFGTGTEDYYGNAWCDPTPFVKPYHAEPTSGQPLGYPGNFGHTTVNRFHIFDPIHFQKSILFTLEEWHWADTDCTYTHTSYWYARPGGTPPAPIPTGLLLIPKLTPPEPVKGGIEGEGMKVLQATGGTVEKQDGFWETSGQSQLWWRDGKPGDKLVLEFQVPESGRYKVIGNFCHARDYGIQKISVNGQTPVTIDFYSSELGWHKSELGTLDLPAGAVRLEVEVAGTNPAADPRHMFGLDYLLLERV